MTESRSTEANESAPHKKDDVDTFMYQFLSHFYRHVHGGYGRMSFDAIVGVYVCACACLFLDTDKDTQRTP